MSSSIPAEPSSISATDEDSRVCVALFREATSLNSSPRGAAMSDADVLAADISSLEVDSLATLDFVMSVEDHFGVEFDEADVNRCAVLADFVALVRRARDA